VRSELRVHSSYLLQLFAASSRVSLVVGTPLVAVAVDIAVAVISLTLYARQLGCTALAAAYVVVT
jgi:hypothetical protein